MVARRRRVSARTSPMVTTATHLVDADLGEQGIARPPSLRVETRRQGCHLLAYSSTSCICVR